MVVAGAGVIGYRVDLTIHQCLVVGGRGVVEPPVTILPVSCGSLGVVGISVAAVELCVVEEEVVDRVAVHRLQVAGRAEVVADQRVRP